MADEMPGDLLRPSTDEAIKQQHHYGARRFSASLSVAIDEANTHTSMKNVPTPIISIIEHLSCHSFKL
jgi:hypothetical protein